MCEKIRIAIIGIGNCAKSLVEGISYYSEEDLTIGLMHRTIGDFQVSDIEIVAAFDIDRRKVGKKLNDAILSEPNNTISISKLKSSKVTVQRGPTLDSVIDELKDYYLLESDLPSVDVAKILQKSRAQIVLNYLPTGSIEATYAYAQAALDSNCNFVNCMPTPIGKDSKWRRKFESKGLILLGDDIKSQMGATVLNREILNLLKLRGVKINSTSQINYGGNADHYNLKFRPEAKKVAKEAALRAFLANDSLVETKMIYKHENKDHKVAHINIHGEIFGRIPVKIEIKLDDEDSPNSAGVVVDAIRIIALMGKNNHTNLSYINDVSPWLMKSPPIQLTEENAYEQFNSVIESCKENSFKKIPITKR